MAKQRIAIINIVESGHNVLSAVLQDLSDIFSDYEVVGKVNIYEGVIDTTNEVFYVIENTDNILRRILRKSPDVIIVVPTGPYIISFMALWRIIRVATRAHIYIAQFIKNTKHYVFYDVDDLFNRVYKPYIGVE